MTIQEIIEKVSVHTGKKSILIKNSIPRLELRPARIMVSVLALTHGYPHEIISYTLGKKHKSFSCRLVKSLNDLNDADIQFLMENANKPSKGPSLSVYKKLEKYAK